MGFAKVENLDFWRKIVKSPPMWASYSIKCPTVRAWKNCQIPLAFGMPVVLQYVLYGTNY